MEFKQILTGNLHNEFIEDKIDLIRLDERRKKEEINKKLKGGEHCFRIADNWYRLNMGYTNPLNCAKVHAELLLMEGLSKKDKLDMINLVKDKEFIFYGVGVGDTEIVPINWALDYKSPEVYITGIDVNREFLENFIIALKNKLIESPKSKIFYRAYHSLFEQINKKDLNSNLLKVHFCLGNTIGNFDNQDEVFKMFSNLSQKEDLLVLGIQLNRKLDMLFEKYKDNSLFQKFILNYVDKNEKVNLNWNLDKKNGIISAKYNDVEVFRTKKYNENKLKQDLEKNDFKLLKQWIDQDENACIQIYKKIK